LHQKFGAMSENHSTVTDLFGSVVYDAVLTFDIVLKTKNLVDFPYSKHQQFLYKTIKEMHGQGLNFIQISSWLNNHHHKTHYGHIFTNNHCFALLKKGRIREERETSKPVVNYDNFALKLIPKGIRKT
jgi:hypothetical protein